MLRINGLLMCSAALAVTVATGCVGGGSTARLDGGSARLNSALRHDFGPNPGQTNPGQHFAACELPPDFPSAACELIDPVVVRSVAPADLRRLRRAPFLWISAGPSTSGALLTYEWVADGVNIVELPSGQVLAPDLDLGTCINFGEFDERTRQRITLNDGRQMRMPPVAGLDDALAVRLRSCVAPPTDRNAINVSETLAPLTDICDDGVDLRQLRASASGWTPTAQEVWPVCVKNLPLALGERDTRYELDVVARTDISQRLWSNARLEAQPVGPQLMTVPVGGSRTISRQMIWSRNVLDDGGVERPSFEFQIPLVQPGYASELNARVPTASGDWLENFSPNVVVSHVRVRRGPWRAGSVPEYLNISRLRIGGTRCLTRTDRPGVDEFDIMLCRIEDAELAPVTPAYRLDQFLLGQIGDGRITWEAIVSAGPGSAPATPTDPVFIEFDLTAVDSMSTARSALIAAPSVQNFGLLRAAVASPPRWAARIENGDRTGLRIDRIEISGRNAAEFGLPLVRRLPATAAAAMPAISTMPLALSASSAIDVFLAPLLVGNEIKEGQLDVYFTGISNRQDRISVALRAIAASPNLSLLPERLQMHFEGSLAQTTFRRGFLVTNSGYASSERRAIRIEGADRQYFELAPEATGVSLAELQRPRTLGSGEAESLFVTYKPPAPGRHQAALILETADGPLRLELEGSCVGYCSQPLAVDPRLRPRDGPRVERLDSRRP